MFHGDDYNCFNIIIVLNFLLFVNLVSSMNGSKEKTFQLQDKLPSLPVPSLAQTCEKYLDSGTDIHE